MGKRFSVQLVLVTDTVKGVVFSFTDSLEILRGENNGLVR